MNYREGEVIDRILADGEFGMRKLIISGIENDSVLRLNDPRMAEEETCLFHRNFTGGDDYLGALHASVADSISARKHLPVVRFADGEYAFYGRSLQCNGLYRQAESVREIEESMPMHAEALKKLTQLGRIAPLVFPGNIRKRKRRFFGLLSSKSNPSARDFLEFLHRHDADLGPGNYVPFYVVYAYLTSRRFAETVHGKNICIVSSEFREEHAREAFGRLESRPDLGFVEIPDSYVATQWPAMKDRTLAAIPADTDICLVGAGVGALPVCVDIAVKFSIPAIDAGHVLNMINGREDKSNGPRLYTMWGVGH